MSEIKCAIEECQTKFLTGEVLAENVRFVCKNHSRKEQCSVIGRKFNPEKDTQDERIRLQNVSFDPMIDQRIEFSDHASLRKMFDGGDGFMSSHQIIDTNGATLHDGRVSESPDWVFSDDEVQKLLLTSFPKLNQDSEIGKKQRARASRWAAIIYWYHRYGWTDDKIAEELNESTKKIQLTLQSIKRVSEGKTARGSGLRRKMGRPKKSRAGIRTSSGNSGDDSHITL